MKLYEISSELMEVVSSYDNGDITEQEFIQSVNDLKGDFNGKIDNIASLIKSLNAEAKAIKEEIKGLQARAKAKENQVNGLMEYLQINFTNLGLEKLETSKNVISFRKNPVKVVVENEEEFIENFKGTGIIKESYSIDKTFIKEQLKDGQIIEGAKLVQDKVIKIK